MNVRFLPTLWHRTQQLISICCLSQDSFGLISTEMQNDRIKQLAQIKSDMTKSFKKCYYSHTVQDKGRRDAFKTEGKQ